MLDMVEYGSHQRILRKVGFMHARSTQHAEVCEVVLRVYGQQCCPVKQHARYHARGTLPGRRCARGLEHSVSRAVENAIQARKLGHGSGGRRPLRMAAVRAPDFHAIEHGREHVGTKHLHFTDTWISVSSSTGSHWCWAPPARETAW
jgi:hypothetical protein